MNGSTDPERESTGNGVQPDAELLTPAQVAKMFHVDPKTVTRWAQAGKLTYMRTLGGHRRYRRDEVVDLLRNSTGDE